VDFRELLAPSGPRRPFHGEHVAHDRRGVAIGLDRPGAYDLAALLPDGLELHEIALDRHARLFGELAARGGQRVLAGADLALRDRPGAGVAPAPEGTAGMHEEDLELPEPAEEKQSRACSCHAPIPTRRISVTRKTVNDFDPEVLKLFDGYVHGRITRREFLDRAARFVVGGVSAAGLLEMLQPNFAMGEQIPEQDSRVRTETIEYPSPKGSGTMKGYLAQPAQAQGKRGCIVVIHENRGLNPHIKDIARRLALEGYT